MIAKDYVQQRFPKATVAARGGLFRVEGVPGMLADGESEEFAWQAAAQYLADPVKVLHAPVHSNKAVFDLDANVAVRERFAAGEGVVALQPGMDDKAILAIIKFAISNSGGKAFLVVPPSQ